MKALLLLIAGLVALCSCSSPLELDTPREKTYDSIPNPGTQQTVGTSGRVRQQGAITPPPHAVARQVVVTFSNDNAVTVENYDCLWTLEEIDTSGAVPAVWLHGICTLPQGSSMVLQRMTLGIDSMAANGTTVGTTHPPATSPGGELELGDGFVSNKVVVPNGADTRLELQIAKTGPTRLEGTIHIEALFNNRGVSLNGTITIDY